MKEKSIIFNSEMVRAVLEGRKTQTRRILKYQAKQIYEINGLYGINPCMEGILVKYFDKTFSCPYGQSGDRLWVRETWCQVDLQTICYASSPEFIPKYLENLGPNWLKWKPSIHMPRWASRITLEITDVRVERLNDISEEDAQSESSECLIGCRCYECCQGEYRACLTGEANFERQYSDGFIKLWESIHGKGSWDLNPWVWVIEFKKIN